MYNILVINPGSTSTKIAVFHDEKVIFQQNLRHSGDELKPFPMIASQYEFRQEAVLNCLADHNIPLDFDIIVGRGGILKPLNSGVYAITEIMKAELLSAKYGEHASNLGGLIASNIADSIGCKAVIADPVVVDELQDVARISGHPLFPRISIFHALNQKATARIYAAEKQSKYEDLNLIVAHLGGGISVGAHCKGKVIDTNNAVDYGPFSPERSGTISLVGLTKLCFSGKYTLDQVQKMLNGEGGLMAHLGTNEAHVAVERAKNGDKKAQLVIEALAYNVAKEIGSMATVLQGKVDAILLTGGIAYNTYITDHISKMVQFIAPISIYPGEDELWALASNGIHALKTQFIFDYE
ncbi:MAG TPA: butyrate kinase [Paludibacteraceae bacterium]|jgi:butyrate kinase|nr:butyrate kinase [Paludibacteraceae bacterium]